MTDFRAGAAFLRLVYDGGGQTMKMTKEEFRKRWDSDDNGGGITFDDVADCAKAWGLFSTPRICDINKVLKAVVNAAGCKTGV